MKISSSHLLNGCNGHPEAATTSSNGPLNLGEEKYLNGHQDGFYATSNGTADSQTRLLVWSGSDESACVRLTSMFADYLGTRPSSNSGYLDALAYTLNCRRSIFPWRSFALVNSDDSLKGLGKLLSRPVRSSKSTGIAFTFTGQGAQYKRMGVELLHYSVFGHTLECFDMALRMLGCDWSLIGEDDCQLRCYSASHF